MMEVVLKIKIPESWMNDIKNKYDASIKFLDCMPVGKSGGRGLIEIDATDTEIDKIIEDLKRHEAVCKVDVSPSPDGGVLSSIDVTIGERPARHGRKKVKHERHGKGHRHHRPHRHP